MIIEKTVLQRDEPQAKNVLWVKPTDDGAEVLAFNNGEWKKVSGGEEKIDEKIEEVVKELENDLNNKSISEYDAPFSNHNIEVKYDYTDYDSGVTSRAVYNWTKTIYTTDYDKLYDALEKGKRVSLSLPNDDEHGIVISYIAYPNANSNNTYNYKYTGENREYNDDYGGFDTTIIEEPVSERRMTLLVWIPSNVTDGLDYSTCLRLYEYVEPNPDVEYYVGNSIEDDDDRVVDVKVDLGLVEVGTIWEEKISRLKRIGTISGTSPMDRLAAAENNISSIAKKVNNITDSINKANSYYIVQITFSDSDYKTGTASRSLQGIGFNDVYTKVRYIYCTDTDNSDEDWNIGYPIFFDEYNEDIAYVMFPETGCIYKHDGWSFTFVRKVVTEDLTSQFTSMETRIKALEDKLSSSEQTETTSGTEAS